MSAHATWSEAFPEPGNGVNVVQFATNDGVTYESGTPVWSDYSMELFDCEMCSGSPGNSLAELFSEDKVPDPVVVEASAATDYIKVHGPRHAVQVALIRRAYEEQVRRAAPNQSALLVVSKHYCRKEMR